MNSYDEATVTAVVSTQRLDNFQRRFAFSDNYYVPIGKNYSRREERERRNLMKPLSSPHWRNYHNYSNNTVEKN